MAVDPAGAIAEVAAGGIGLVESGLQGTLGAIGHLENIVVAVPNEVLLTVSEVGQAGLAGGAQVGQTVTGTVDRGFDTVLAHVKSLVAQAARELEEGLDEFGAGMPKVAAG